MGVGAGGAVVSWGSEPARKTEHRRATQVNTEQAVVCAPKEVQAAVGPGLSWEPGKVSE